MTLLADTCMINDQSFSGAADDESARDGTKKRRIAGSSSSVLMDRNTRLGSQALDAPIRTPSLSLSFSSSSSLPVPSQREADVHEEEATQSAPIAVDSSAGAAGDGGDGGGVGKHAGKSTARRGVLGRTGGTALFPARRVLRK